MGRALGELEQAILLAVVELEEDAYGASIGRSMEERTGRTVSSGAIYTALDRLEGRGMVTSRIGAPTGERGGRRRKHYTLTPEGAYELQQSVRRLQSMAEGLMPKVDRLAEEHS